MKNVSQFLERLSLTRINIQCGSNQLELLAPNFTGVDNLRLKNTAGAAVWYSLLEHKGRARSRDTAIACWGICIEFDDGTRWESIAEQFKECVPSFVVHSGRGDHLVWVLDKNERVDALALSGDLSKRLAKKFNSDISAANSSPMSRLPFFFYAKDNQVKGPFIEVDYLREAFDDARLEEIAELAGTTVEELHETATLGKIDEEAQKPEEFAELTVQTEQRVRAAIKKRFDTERAKKSGRNTTLFMSAVQFAKYNIESIDPFVKYLGELNNKFAPPLSEREFNALVKNAGKNAYRYVKPNMLLNKSKVPLCDSDFEKSHVETLNFQEYEEHDCVTAPAGHGYERILNCVPEIKKILKDEDTKEQQVQFLAKGMLLQYPTQTLVDARKVLELSNEGLYVSSSTAKQVSKYFAAKLLDSECLATKTYSTWGWHDGEFWIGADKISPDGSCPSDVIAKDRQLLREMQCRGDKDKAFEAVRLLIKDPAYAIMMSASLSALLLEPLGRQGFTVHQIGAPQKGKSILSGVCASLFGGQVLKGTWNCSEFAFENQAAMMPDFPQILDDSDMKRAGLGSKSIVSNLLYIAANGAARKIGSNGGNRETKKFRTVIISNGVNPISEEAEQAGSMSRVMELNLLPALEPSLCEQMQHVLETNCGHVVRGFAQKVAPMFKRLDLERHLFVAKQSDMQERLREAGDVSAARHASQICLIDRAYGLLCAVLDVSPVLDIAAGLSARTCAEAGSIEKDVVRRDVETVLDEILARESLLARVTKDGIRIGTDLPPLTGWIGYQCDEDDGWAYIRPAALKAICKQHGLVSTRIIRQMQSLEACKEETRKQFDGNRQRYRPIKIS